MTFSNFENVGIGNEVRQLNWHPSNYSFISQVYDNIDKNGPRIDSVPSLKIYANN